MTNPHRMNNLQPAQYPEFPRAKVELGERVHVEGWAKGAVFTIVAIGEPDPDTCIIRAVKKQTDYPVPTEKLLGLKWRFTPNEPSRV